LSSLSPLGATGFSVMSDHLRVQHVRAPLSTAAPWTPAVDKSSRRAPGDDTWRQPGLSVPAPDSSSATRSAASVISSASTPTVRWNHSIASSVRPAARRVSAYA
jgi:hypothetical protein